MDSKNKKEIALERLARENEQIELNKKNYDNFHTKRPLTRRELLGAGVLSFSASLTFPSLASLMLPAMAKADPGNACPSQSQQSGFMPFINLNLAGGAMLAANYVPMDAGGQTLASYDKMGMGNSSLPIDREFNNVPFAGDGISNILTQIRAVCTQDTLDKTAFVAIPCRSQDDSSNNQMDATGLVAAAGRVGANLPNLVSSVRNNFTTIKPPNPLSVNNINSILSAMEIGGTGALSSLSDQQRVSLVKLIGQLSQKQTRSVASESGGEMLGQLIGCANQKNLQVAQAEKPQVDVRQVQNLAQIWGVDQNTGANNREAVFGSMVQACLIGEAGTAILQNGGYDYHVNNRTLGNERDAMAGADIGRILQSAAALNTPVFIHVTSDGSCSSPVSDDRQAPWRSDRGSAGIMYMLVFHPSGRPETSTFQIGQFTNAQAADETFITGGNPALASAAVFVNYLKLNNRMDLVAPILGGTFSNSDIDKILAFKG